MRAITVKSNGKEASLRGPHLLTRSQDPHSRSTSRRAIHLVLAAFIVFSLIGSVLLSAPRSAQAASATTTDYLNLRTGSSYDHSILLVMPVGVSVTVTGDAQNGFYPVTYQGTSGWAHGDWLSISGESGSSGTGTAVTTANLNLRAGASYNDHVLTVIPYGATVTVNGGAQNGFYPVTYNGTAGWSHGDYLTVSGQPNAAAEPAPVNNTSTGTAVTTANLNLRSGASYNDRVLTVIPQGAQVTLNGDPQNGFYPVTYNGTSGWSHGDWLSIGGSSGNSDNSAPPKPAGSSYTTQEIIDIIYAAADRYGQPREDMLRVARCESNLDPNAVGAGSLGLFQFLRGTWATTPYASYDIFDPWASANAAGWMWSVGRRGEWTCQ